MIKMVDKFGYFTSMFNKLEYKDVVSVPKVVLYIYI